MGGEDGAYGELRSVREGLRRAREELANEAVVSPSAMGDEVGGREDLQYFQDAEQEDKATDSLCEDLYEWISSLLRGGDNVVKKIEQVEREKQGELESMQRVLDEAINAKIKLEKQFEALEAKEKGDAEKLRELERGEVELKREKTEAGERIGGLEEELKREKEAVAEKAGRVFELETGCSEVKRQLEDAQREVGLCSVVIR